MIQINEASKVNISTMIFTGNKHVVLRKETFGGIAFHKKLGITIELDKEGQYVLESLDRPKRIKDLTQDMSETFHTKSFSEHEIEKFISDLIELEFVNKCSKEEINEKDCISITHKKNHENNSGLSAPETVHLTLTNKCNLNCTLCYEMKNNRSEMPKDAIFDLIDKLAAMRVFQLAIGGGEPFLREDIYEIIEYCQKKGIVPNITTNGTLIDYPVIKRIKNKVGGISVSLNGYSSETNIGRDSRSFIHAVHSIKCLLEEDIPTGTNVLVSSESLPYLMDTLDFIRGLGVRWINILRPKPVLSDEHFDQYLLLKDDLIYLKKVLDHWSGIITINVDTALACLMYTVPIERLRENAVFGCVAGTRFCTIDCNGDVFPCSFFKGSEYVAGNILKEDLQDIWLNSNVFKKFRMIRKNLKGRCKNCTSKDYCGGCRSIALNQNNDIYGEDEVCIKNFRG